jgi:hypothetical protein
VKHKANGRKVRTQVTFQAAATKAIIDELSPVDLQAYEEVRQKWTLSGPPVEVRQK